MWKISSRQSMKWVLILVILGTLVLPYFILDHLEDSSPKSSSKLTVSLQKSHYGRPIMHEFVLPSKEDVESNLDLSAFREFEDDPSQANSPLNDPIEPEDLNFPEIDQAINTFEKTLNELYANANGKLLDDLRALVTVGIKTFNRPACALNLLKSILFYYPGISIVIVNDGEDDVLISDTTWQLYDPSGSSNALIEVDLDIRYETISNLDEFMQSQRPLFPIVVSSGDGSRILSSIRIINIPFDSGVSVGRNVLVKSCETKYILMTDDDYEFVPETDIGLMMQILESSENPDYTDKLTNIFGNSRLPLDIVGGIRSEGALAGSQTFPRGSNFELTTVPMKELFGSLSNYTHVYPADSDNINLLRIKPSWEQASKLALGLPETEEEDQNDETLKLANLLYDGNCLPTQFIQQFFMARTESLRGTSSTNSNSILWDPFLKNNDHYDFFLRATNTLPSLKNSNTLSILGCSAIKYKHAKTSEGACAQDTKLRKGPNASTYMQFRNRWVKFIPYLFNKWNIGLVIDDEIGKTIVVSRDTKNSSKCHVTELRKIAARNKDYDYDC